MILPPDDSFQTSADTDDLVCSGGVLQLFESGSIQEAVELMTSTMLFEVCVSDEPMQLKEALDATKNTERSEKPVVKKREGGGGKSSADRVAAKVDASAVMTSEILKYWVQAAAWTVWVPFVLLTKHGIPWGRPDNKSLDPLIRGLLKWAFLKKCTARGVAATKTSQVFGELKRAVVVQWPAIFHDKVLSTMLGSSFESTKSTESQSDSLDVQIIFKEPVDATTPRAADPKVSPTQR